MNMVSRHSFRPIFSRLFPVRMAVLPLLAICLLFSGCFGLGKKSPMIERYTLEYPSPTFENLTRLDQTIKVERFSVAKAFNTESMVFRPDAFKLDTYASHRWMVNPGDMTSDYLLRDLRNSGLFRAVFSYRDYDDARFVLEGGLEEFMEVDEGKGRSAVLTLTVNLLDLSRTGTPSRLIFQKKYRSVEPIPDADPAGLARAMSTGAGKVSAQVIKDVYGAVLNLY